MSNYFPDRYCIRLACFARAELWALALERVVNDSAILDRGRTIDPAIIVRAAGSTDARLLGNVMRVPESVVVSRLERGRRCYIATVSQEIVSYGWISLGHEDLPELERAVHPGRGECYTWDCFTVPKYRGLGILPALLRQMASDLQTLHLHRAWGVIMAKNDASQRAFAKAGFERVANLLYLRLLGKGFLRLITQPGANPDQLVAARCLLM